MQEGELGKRWEGLKRRTLKGKYISMARIPMSLGRASEGWAVVPLEWRPLARTPFGEAISGERDSGEGEGKG